MNRMDDEQFAKALLYYLCDYVGDAVVFEIFVEKWGAEDLHETLNQLLGGITTDYQEAVEDAQDSNGEG